MDGEKNAAGQTLEAFLAAYDPGKYERPSVTVDVVLFTLLPGDPVRLGVLLIKRGDHPFINMWALPGGFIGMDEDLVESAHRELREETGVQDVTLTGLGVFGAPDRDPRTRVISVAYTGLVPMGALQPRAGDDAADAQLFSVLTFREQGKDAMRTMIALQDAGSAKRPGRAGAYAHRGRRFAGQRPCADPRAGAGPAPSYATRPVGGTHAAARFHEEPVRKSLRGGVRRGTAVSSGANSPSLILPELFLNSGSIQSSFTMMITPYRGFFQESTHYTV